MVACGDGAVQVAEVQPAGRRRMAAAEWLRGRAASRSVHRLLVRPLPRLHAITDDAVLADADVGIRAAAIAAAGPAAALHVRARKQLGAFLAAVRHAVRVAGAHRRKRRSS